ncbi:hypothetical protein DF046_17585 [Burkholderia cepacia]|nr:hypothetical protein BZY94_40690 [Burkholderia territorii]RQT52888.1 hypothetical protein DF046_17585 [Burkholderia cepacia]RQT95562.1 hypothetical protein DF041_16025 [Burkholderia cepacia]
MQDVQVELIRPPVLVRRAATSGVVERALRFVRHAISPWLARMTPPVRSGGMPGAVWWSVIAGMGNGTG